MEIEHYQNSELPIEKKLNVVTLTIFLLITSIAVYSLIYNYIQHKKNIELIQKNNVLEKQINIYKNIAKTIQFKRQKN